jgi:citrate lyase beta subunit
LLFVPGSSPHRVEKALRSDADAVVIDLEDAVAPSAKAAARSAVAEFLTAGPLERRPWLRINGADTAWNADDMAAAHDLPLAGIVAPKASRQALDSLDLASLPVIALIETSHGVREAYDVARHPNVEVLMLGGADLGAELGWPDAPTALELLPVRSGLVIDSAAAGIRAPFDVVHLQFDDTDGLAAECAAARAVGMGGKACIHPAQLCTVHEAFTPTEAEQATANRLINAYEAAVAAGDGVAVVDNKMVDAPVIARARAVLAKAAGDRADRQGVLA